MILVDTPVWIDHLNRPEPDLIDLLEREEVLGHPMVLGEIAVGSLPNRSAVLDAVGRLTDAPIASHHEVLYLVEERGLHGKGLHLVDVHLLASALIGEGVWLWTRDKRLSSVTASLDVAYRNTQRIEAD